MKRFCVIILLCLNFTIFAQNEQISYIINHINKDSIYKNVKDLENFTTRFAFAKNNKDVAIYLQNRMQQYGFETIIDSFYLSDCQLFSDNKLFDGWLYNVLSVKYSDNMLDIDTSLILSAHYDCISNIDGFEDYMHFAPGADDNASGVAVLLELARIWSNYSNKTNKNLRIEFYDAEELNLTGSNYRMQQISSPWNMHLIGNINLDMVGFDTCNTVSLNYYDNSQNFTDIAIKNIQLYTDLNYNLTQQYIKRSDSWVFYSWGLKTLFISEADFSPYYHSLQDSSIYLNYEYMQKITRFTTALTYDIINDYQNISLSYPTIQSFDYYVNNNNLIIHFNKKDTHKISIFDTFGRIRCNLQTKNNTISIPINQLEMGVYFFTITNSTNTITNKFIK